MLSSQGSAALGRARSLRKPTTRSDTAATDQNNEQRSTSPSRLPVKLTPSTTGTGTLRREAGEVRGSRPLSGVFGRSSATAGVGGRQISTSTSADSSTRLARAPSVRQVPTASSNTEASGTSGTSRLTRAASIRQLSTSSAKSGASGTSEGSSIAPPRRPTTTTTTTTTEKPTPLSRRPTVTEANSTSSRRPTTSSGVPPRRIPFTTTAGSHSRAKSSVTALTNTTILRPPSSTSQTSTATSASTERNDRSKPPITRSTGAVASHKRAPSHPTPSTPGAGIGRTRSLKLEGPAGIVKPKPEFTTHQQHFSPLKNPHVSKPLTSAILAPPSPSKLPGNVAISAETARLQTELLQLSLLHSSAGETKAQWEASAYEKLKGRFEAVVEQEKEVLGLENRSVESSAVRELLEWGKGRGGLEEKVRVSDEVLGAIWALTEPYSHNHRGGRYTRLVRHFERWLAGAEEIMVLRGEGSGGELVGEIGADWKEELGNMSRKTHALRQDLYGILEGYLQEDGQESNLGRVLKEVREFIEGMVREIEIMELVEKEVREREMEWVRDVNREGEMAGEMRRRAGAVWRAF